MAYLPINSGSTTLVAGAKEVADSRLTSASKVFATVAGVGGVIGILSVSVTAGSSFVISSASAIDTSLVNYLVIY